MKNLVFLFALSALAVAPVRAGVGASGHAGGFGGGGFHGFSGTSHASSESYRGSSYFGGRYRCYGRGYGYGYPYLFGGYASYPYVDDSYDDGDSYSPSGYAPTQSSYPSPASPPTTTPSIPMASSGPLPMGTIDPSGYIHSPYTNSAFKVENLTDGQVLHDPVTGQLFVAYVNKTPATPVPASVNPTPPTQATPPTPSTPTGPIPAPSPTTALPMGKLDQFGYVHSPFSTFLFKVQNGNYAQVFRDPFTGQSFGVRAVPAAPSLASAPVID